MQVAVRGASDDRKIAAEDWKCRYDGQNSDKTLCLEANLTTCS
jgi:hypothetical protein